MTVKLNFSIKRILYVDSPELVLSVVEFCKINMIITSHQQLLQIILCRDPRNIFHCQQKCFCDHHNDFFGQISCRSRTQSEVFGSLLNYLDVVGRFEMRSQFFRVSFLQSFASLRTWKTYSLYEKSAFVSCA